MGKKYKVKLKANFCSQGGDPKTGGYKVNTPFTIIIGDTRQDTPNWFVDNKTGWMWETQDFIWLDENPRKAPSWL